MSASPLSEITIEDTPRKLLEFQEKFAEKERKIMRFEEEISILKLDLKYLREEHENLKKSYFNASKEIKQKPNGLNHSDVLSPRKNLELHVSDSEFSSLLKENSNKKTVANHIVSRDNAQKPLSGKKNPRSTKESINQSKMSTAAVEESKYIYTFNFVNIF